MLFGKKEEDTFHFVVVAKMKVYTMRMADVSRQPGRSGSDLIPARDLIVWVHKGRPTSLEFRIRFPPQHSIYSSPSALIYQGPDFDQDQNRTTTTHKKKSVCVFVCVVCVTGRRMVFGEGHGGASILEIRSCMAT